MSKFNRTKALLQGAKARVTSPISGTAADATTYEGGAGYVRDAKSELFLLAVSHFVGEDTFYERAGDRDDRFAALVAEVAVSDVDWLTRFTAWLRGTANIRSAALVAAAEGVAARLAAGEHGGSRALVSAALRRPDEPGELVAYWLARRGRALPKPVKRGIGDAVGRLYTEAAVAKYDTAASAVRFGDVLELTHPSPVSAAQGELFAYAITRRHGRDTGVPEALPLLAAREKLLALPVDERGAVLQGSLGEPAEVLRRAGMSWESVSGWLQGPMDAEAWSALIPSMGYMALLRNLRNFDEAGVPDAVADRVAARLSDPEQVARSRQLPMRFLSAYRAAPSLRWASALDRALSLSLANVPSLPGRTLVLVDRSGSMFGRLSRHSQLDRADAAALFGTAVAVRAESADLVQFGSTSATVNVGKGESVLTVLERFGDLGGTETAAAVRAHYRGHDRVLIVTDEQVWGGWQGSDPTEQVPAHVPVYTWNLAGYRVGHGPSGSGNRHTFGGLSDAAFGMVPLLESGQNADWPF